jgi:hypothetical protein
MLQIVLLSNVKRHYFRFAISELADEGMVEEAAKYAARTIVVLRNGYTKVL